MLITASAQFNLIGGTSVAARNVIGVQSQGAVAISFANNNTVQGNYAGISATGAAPIGGGRYAMVIYAAEDNIIGGTAEGTGNIIGGNLNMGIWLLTELNVSTIHANNKIQGNFIGAKPDGTKTVGDMAIGIRVSGDCRDNIIGLAPDGTGKGNVIAYTTTRANEINRGGVPVKTPDAEFPPGSAIFPTGTTIRGNSIYSNQGLGINIQPAGEAVDIVTPNDAQDTDGGPNSVQNFPVLNAVSSGATTTVGGTLNSTPNRSYLIDFYSNNATHASGYGEGQTYLGAVEVTTNASGNASFTFSASGVSADQLVSATATDKVTGDTSEFSAAISVIPTFTLRGRIIKSDGTALSGVTITAKVGTTTRTGTTGSTGNYSITQVPGGTAMLTPSLTGYTFTPTSRSISVSADQTGLDFVAAVATATGVTLTSPLDHASISANTTVRAETQGAIQRVSFSRRKTASFTRTPNAPIPDYTTEPGKVTDSQTITASGTVANASLSVNINHPYINDISIVLIAPDGTRLTVREQSGGSSDNINQTYANLALSSTPMARTWQLEVSDNGFYDTGTLVSWSLRLSDSWVLIGDGVQNTPGVWTAPWSTQGTSAGVYEVRAFAVHASGSVTDVNQNITVVKSTFDISGRITTTDNVGIANVQVMRSGSATPVSTDENGNYTFTDVPAGSYNITPTSAQHSFDPAMKSVTVSGANVSGVNFIGTPAPTYSIRGRVFNNSGVGLANVQITRTGGSSAITDANGNYVFSDIAAGTYTIAPVLSAALSGVTFSPDQLSVTVSNSDAFNQNFIASFSISGRLTNHSGVGIPNVLIQRRAGTSTVGMFTDANGNYTFPNVRSGS